MLDDFRGKKTVKDRLVPSPELHFEIFNITLLHQLFQCDLSFVLFDKNIKFVAGFSYDVLPGKTERPQNGFIDVDVFFFGKS